MHVRGAHVLITGGAGGIGRALAEAFTTADAVVVTADLAGRGADLDLDVTDGPAVAAAIDGMTRIDVVVANAGIGVGGCAEDVPAADWARSIEVNIAGTVNTVLPAYRRMREQGSGTIVLMASVAGLVGTPLLSAYAMTKAAMVGLGASLGPEARRHGVGVLTVCPGPVETELLDADSHTPGLSVRRYLTAAAGRPMAPSELATMVVRATERGSVLLTPGRAGLLGALARHAPRATAWQVRRNLDRELSHTSR